MVEIQAYQCSDTISYLLKLAWQLPSGISFDYVIATAYIQTITLLYIYLCIWGLDLRLNNINYPYWWVDYSSPIIIISLYWTSETLPSSSITTSEWLICDNTHRPRSVIYKVNDFILKTLSSSLVLILILLYVKSIHSEDMFPWQCFHYKS